MSITVIFSDHFKEIPKIKLLTERNYLQLLKHKVTKSIKGLHIGDTETITSLFIPA